MQPQIERYEGPNPKDGMLAGVRGLLSNTDPQLKAFAAHMQREAPKRQYAPVESAPYTVAAIGLLQEREPDFAVRALDVLAHIRMLNNAREESVYYTHLTFAPGLTPENHEQAAENISENDRQMVRRARIIVDKITELEMLR